MFSLTMMLAAAAAQPSPPAAQPAPAPVVQSTAPGQMDHSRMDHGKLGHSTMGRDGHSCCTRTAEGKMECSMPAEGADSAHQGHSGH